MSLSDFQTQNGKRRRETSESFDSVFSFLMDFANEAEIIVPQPKRRVVVDDDTTDGNAGEMFDKLPVKDKEELLKAVFGEIVGNILDKLPEDEKETFLVRCFDGLFPKLHCESQRAIEIKVNGVFSQSQEAFATLSAPESPLAIPNQFPTDDLCPVKFSVTYPNTIGGRGRGGRGGAGGGGRRGGRR